MASYYRDLDWGLIYKWSLMSNSYYGTVKNVDVTSEGPFTKPFWSACIECPMLTRLGVQYSWRDCLEDPK